MTPTSLFSLTAAIGAAAIVATGCAEDDILVYREHPPHPTAEGGEQPLETGGKTAAAGGLRNAGGAPRGAGGSSSGGREPPADAAPPRSGGSSGGLVTGGTSSTGGASGALGFAGRSSGGTVGLGNQCSTNTDCAGNFYCEKPDCSAPFGVCLPPPTLCPDATPLPVCGCDGVTYWHDCLRKQHGVSATTLNECAVNVRTCTTSADCGIAGASCSHLTPIPMQACGVPGPGICWMTPPDCTQTPLAPSWVPCQPPPGTSTRPACVSTCEAIRSGMEYVAAMGPCR